MSRRCRVTFTPIRVGPIGSKYNGISQNQILFLPVKRCNFFCFFVIVLAQIRYKRGRWQGAAWARGLRGVLRGRVVVVRIFPFRDSSASSSSFSFPICERIRSTFTSRVYDVLRGASSTNQMSFNYRQANLRWSTSFLHPDDSGALF